MWLLSNGSFIDDLEAEQLSWHFPYGVSHFEECLKCNHLAVIGGSQGFRDGIKLDFVKFIISSEDCLLGHVVIPNMVLPQPILPSLWWLPHSFLNDLIQCSDIGNWDVIRATSYQLLGSLMPVGLSAGKGIYHFWFCNPHTCFRTVKQCSTHSTLMLPMIKCSPLVSIYVLRSITGTSYFAKD